MVRQRSSKELTRIAKCWTIPEKWSDWRSTDQGQKIRGIKRGKSGIDSFEIIYNPRKKRINLEIIISLLVTKS